MGDFVPALISVIVCCILLSAGFGFLPCIAEKKQLYYKNCGIFSALMTVSALVISILIPSVTHAASVPSPVVAALVTVGGFCGIVLTRHMSDSMVKTFLKRLGKAVIVVFFIEAFVFNFNRFISGEHHITQPSIIPTTITDDDEVLVTEKFVTFEKDTTIYYALDTDEDVRSAEFTFEGDDKWVKATLKMTDENFSSKMISVGSKFFSGTYDRPVCFGIKPYGKLRRLSLTLTDVDDPVTLTSIKLDSVMPYTFSDIRFFVVLLLTAIVIAVVSFKFYKREYDFKISWHRLAMYITAVVCSVSMLMFLVPESSENAPIEYEKGMKIADADPYVQMFDALMKGQASLDVKPSKSLAELESPYDVSERDRSDADYIWDRAYYNGKYYSYYPITPVLLFYYPYYLLSDGRLPNINQSTVFFAMIGVLFMTGALLAFVKRFNKHPNLLLLILSIITCTAAGGYYLGAYYSSQYTFPAVVSTAFLMLCLWCGVSGFNMLGKKISPVLFALSGLAFALCLSARPTKSISALILAPLFIAILIRKNYTLKTKITSAACFLAPALIGITAVMAFNYVRFDSFFEFGQSYQLTVSNVQANHLDLSFLPNSFIHYFMHPLSFSGDFPYVELSGPVICNNGKYMYESRNFGVFNFPLILLGTLAMLFFVWHTRRRKASPYTYNDNRVRNYTYILMFVLMIFVAFADYCVGGAIDAYNMDILPVMMLMSVLVLMDTQTHMRKFPVFEGKTVCFISLACCSTVILTFMVMLSIRDYRMLLEHYPDLFTELERLICFWH